jgi:hypothetical protein
MAQYTRSSVAFVLAAATITAAACGDNRRTEAALSQDTALARDLSLAQAADSARQPQLQDVPASTPPVAPPVTPAPAPEPAPAPAPAPRATTPRPTTTASRSTAAPRTTRRETPRPAPRPAPVATAAGGTSPAAERGERAAADRGERAAAERGGVGTIPSGATLSLASNRKVCTNTNQVGDRFTASLNEAVTGTNGATIPAGATATVELTELDRSENANDKIKMSFRVVSVSYGGRSYAVDATTESADVSRVRNQPSAKDRQKVIGGAIAGAIAGRILGGGTKGTVIGAAGGAAAGAGVAAATANYEGCLNEGAAMRVRLTDAVQVRLSAAN